MKKISPWILGGAVLGGAAGIAFFLLGIWQPGQWTWPEIQAGATASVAKNSKKKFEAFLEQKNLLSAKQERSSADGDTHRVFVSRTLIFLPKDKEPVQPLSVKMVTEDGIEVGWKLKYQFDPEDSTISAEDVDGDGFTNKEEYEKGTNPRDPASSPSKWVKIKIQGVETNLLSISFPGKSEGRYTLRFQYLGKKKDYEVVPGDRLWLTAISKGFDCSRSEEEAKKLKTGETTPHIIPITVREYHEDRGERLDEKTKTPNAYDDSYLVIDRQDGLEGTHKLLFEERGKNRALSWSVGDVRLFSLVPGEAELGPFRVGQKFTYAGKEFVIRDAIPSKVTLWMMPEGQEVQILPKTP